MGGDACGWWQCWWDECSLTVLSSLGNRKMKKNRLLPAMPAGGPAEQDSGTVARRWKGETQWPESRWVGRTLELTWRAWKREVVGRRAWIQSCIDIISFMRAVTISGCWLVEPEVWWWRLRGGTETRELRLVGDLVLESVGVLSLGVLPLWTLGKTDLLQACNCVPPPFPSLTYNSMSGREERRRGE